MDAWPGNTVNVMINKQLSNNMIYAIPKTFQDDLFCSHTQSQCGECCAEEFNSFIPECFCFSSHALFSNSGLSSNVKAVRGTYLP